MMTPTPCNNVPPKIITMAIFKAFQELHLKCGVSGCSTPPPKPPGGSAGLVETMILTLLLK